MKAENKKLLATLGTDTTGHNIKYYEKLIPLRDKFFEYIFTCVFVNSKQFEFHCIDKNIHHARFLKNVELDKHLRTISDSSTEVPK